MFHILEKWLLEAPRHIAVDSPKHCKGCKIKTWISRGSTRYRFYFLDFATLTRFWSCSTWYKNLCLESKHNKATRSKGSNWRQLHTLIKSRHRSQNTIRQLRAQISEYYWGHRSQNTLGELTPQYTGSLNTLGELTPERELKNTPPGLWGARTNLGSLWGASGEPELTCVADLDCVSLKIEASKISVL